MGDAQCDQPNLAGGAPGVLARRHERNTRHFPVVHHAVPAWNTRRGRVEFIGLS